ncbi:alpha/beta fold hydrolase [Streptomyces coeruleorubidus]|uniref:alpha/beta fold hydrolase n=1 Tax=Streptomyces coeruleorubidus TaxID=116188 RepID=UPI00340AF0E8
MTSLPPTAEPCMSGGVPLAGATMLVGASTATASSPEKEKPVPDPGRVRLFTTTLGAAGAPAVLLVHGWGGDGHEWDTAAPEVPDEGNTPAETADDLAALLGTPGPAGANALDSAESTAS